MPSNGQPRAAANPLGLKRLHHLELYVGNALQSAYFYRRGFGFAPLAYRGLETGERGAASYALRQGQATLLLTSPLAADHPAAEHIRRHGDGVRDIALLVADADFAYAEALRRGAEPAEPPRDLRDERGTVRRAAIRAYGDTIHSFFSTRDYSGRFLPGFIPAIPAARDDDDRDFGAGDGAQINADDAGILRIDHIVANVGLGEMERWADFYHRVFGFERYLTFDDKDISTEYSALMSIVMADDAHAVKFPINEPAPGRKKSQIDEYLEAYGGPGVQHVALLTDDALKTVRHLRASGVEFLRVPEAYYRALPARIGNIEESLAEIQALAMLVDRDQEGYLLQIFSRPVQDRPTLFFEIIQRKGSRGFGKGNFKALFEAIEREQARRGNL